MKNYPHLTLGRASRLLAAIGGLAYSLREVGYKKARKYELCSLTITGFFEYHEEKLQEGDSWGEVLALQFPELMRDGEPILPRWDERNYRKHVFTIPES